MKTKKWTSIRISTDLVEALKKHGANTESYENIIVSLLEERYHLIKEIKRANTVIKALLLNPNLPSGDLHDDVRQILKELSEQLKELRFSLPRHQRQKEGMVEAQFENKLKNEKGT